MKQRTVPPVLDDVVLDADAQRIAWVAGRPGPNDSSVLVGGDVAPPGVESEVDSGVVLVGVAVGNTEDGLPGRGVTGIGASSSRGLFSPPPCRMRPTPDALGRLLVCSGHRRQQAMETRFPGQLGEKNVAAIRDAYVHCGGEECSWE